MNETLHVKGTIFNIQHYAIHDGPGIRTTVFFNGCPLRCIWCQNPESQSMKPQMFFNRERCSGCARCVAICYQKANEISEGKSRIDRDLCVSCGDCVENCLNDARQIMGKEMTAGDVFKAVEKDAIFYKESGGGVTLSGGDPISQPEFAASILKLCKGAGMHTAIDTCGYGTWETYKKILSFTDLVLFDFKNLFPEAHKKQTGVSNELILENARKIVHELSIPMLARLPIIPGFNDKVDDIKAIARFIAEELDAGIQVHLLPFHRLGDAKYERLDKPGGILSMDPPDEEKMLSLKRIVESYGLTAHIGG